MSTIKTWDSLPDADLSDRANWHALGNNRYAALRARLLIVQTNGSQSRFGPPIEAHNVAPHDTIELRTRREQVISRTNTISQAVRFAASSRVCDQLSAKVSAELSAKAPGYSGKLSSELLAKSEYELTTTAEETLNSVTSYAIQETQEDEHTIKLEGADVARVAELRRRYWPRRWDFYLHSYEYLELSYEKGWFWGRVRSTIKSTESGVLGWPLVSIVFYEPQADRDVCYGPVADELANPDSVESRTLTDPMPGSVAPKEKKLEDFAKLAFPVTKQEKEASRAKAERKAAAKKPAKRVAAKKAVRKVAAKKTVRKMAAKKTARKSTAKKAVRKMGARK